MIQGYVLIMKQTYQRSLLVILIGFLAAGCSVYLSATLSTGPVVPTETQTMPPQTITQEPQASPRTTFSPSATPVSRTFYTIQPLSIDVSKFEELKRFGNGIVSSMELSPDGRVIALAGGVGIWLYARQDMKNLAHFQASAVWINDIAWSPDGTLLAAAIDDGDVQIWDVKRGNIIQVLKKSNESVLAVAWSPDGRKIVSGGRDNYATIWEWKTGKEIKNLGGIFGTECGSCRAVTALAWSPDAQTIAVVTNRTVRIWELKTDQSSDIFSAWWVSDIKWSPDGKFLAIGCDEGISVVETGTWEKRHELPYFMILGIYWSPQGDKIAASGSGQSQFKENLTSYATIIEWDLVTGKTSERTIEYDNYDLPYNTNYDVIRGIAWTPDGKQIIFDEDGIVWSLSPDGTLISYSLYNAYFNDISLSPDGTHFVTSNGILLSTASESDRKFLGVKRRLVSWSPDGSKIAFLEYEGFRVIDTESWQVRWTTEDYKDELDPNSMSMLDLAWSPDGSQIALKRVPDYNVVQIELWKFEGEKLVSARIIPITAYDFEATDIAWSPDGVLLAFFDKDSLKVYDVASGQQVKSIEKYVGCDSTNWSPDGKYLAMVCDNKKVRILDTWTWEEYRAFDASKDYIWSIDWSPDGLYLVVGEKSGQIGIWDTEKSQNVTNIIGHTQPIRRVLWSNDGSFIVSSSRDGTIRMWGIPPGN